jgi:Zn-dependent protease with chaperone function
MLLKFIEKLTAMPASSIYPNSFVQQDFLGSQGIALNKMKVLGRGSSNGINSQFFSQHPEIMKAAADLKESSRKSSCRWLDMDFCGQIGKRQRDE